MIKSNKFNTINQVLFILIIVSLLLSACTPDNQTIHKTPTKNETSKEPDAPQPLEWKLPITIQEGEGEFDKIVGWLSDLEVLYVTNFEQSSNLVVYDLASGKSSMLYKTESPIVGVQISPSKNFILIHSSPSSFEGVVTIIDTKGTELLKKSFPSYELVFEWNPYNESQVLVSKFDENWSFQLFLLNTKNDQTTEIFLPQPFIKWMNKDEIAFLAWDDNNPTLVAPLKVKGINNGVEKTIVPAAIQFSTFQDLYMTVSVNDQDQSRATYSFFDYKFSKGFTFSIPQLTNFSDWLVPFYDYNRQKGQFITLSPLTSGEVDSYANGFQLLSYDLKTGSKKLIMDNLDNEPLNFSPSGNSLLYGNRFEKIIDLKNNKIYDLIKE